MTHTVAVGEFKGPLGVLLDLVERKKLEVTVISVAEITTGYLEHIRRLDKPAPEELSEFVQLGSRLLYIKSLALLPGEAATEQDEELRKLNLELDEYRRMQAAARQLDQRRDIQTWERRPSGEQLEPAELPLPDIELTRLTVAFTQALKRTTPAPASRLIRKRLSLHTVLTKLRPRLAVGFTVEEIVRQCHDRTEIIVTFLAVLELMRSGEAKVAQADQFAPITVEAAHG